MTVAAMPAPRPGLGIGSAFKPVDMAEVLDRWYVDYDQEIPERSCFIKHVARKGSLYQIVAGHSPDADGVYLLTRFQFGRDGKGRLFVRVSAFEPVPVGTGTRVTRKNMVDCGFLSCQEFDRYFLAGRGAAKRDMVDAHPPIRVIC